MAEPRHGISRPGWIAAALTAAALVLRVACLHQSLFGDELFLWAIVHDEPLRHVLTTVHLTEKTPPLGFVLSWATARGSHADSLVRLPSLIASVGTVPLLYALGRRTVGTWAGLVAAAWFAFSPFEIFYGTEARSYAQVTALVVLTTLALLIAVQDRRRRWWALYAVAAIGAVYSHYIAALVLVPQAAWALVAHRDTIRAQLTANAVVIVAFLPWVPFFVDQFHNSADEARRISQNTPLTLATLGDFLSQPLGGHPYVSLARLPGRPAVVLLGLTVVAAIGFAAAHAVRSGAAVRLPAVASPGVLLVLLATVPAIVIVLYSSQPHASFLLSRNAAVAVPYALLVLGWLLAGAPPVRAAYALSAVALVVVAFGGLQMLRPAYQRPDARSAAAFIDSRDHGAAVVVDVPGPHAIRTYLDPGDRVLTYAQFSPRRWRAAARRGERVFVSYPAAGPFAHGVGPPRQVAGDFRTIAAYRSHGVPFGVGVRGYAPR